MATLVQSLEEKLEKANLKVKAYYTKNMPKNFKSALVTCKNCGSKIAKEYIPEYDCPVCYKPISFMSTTVRETLSKYHENIEKIRKDIYNAKVKASKNVKLIDFKNVKWYNKYNCPISELPLLVHKGEYDYNKPYLSFKDGGDDTWGWAVMYHFLNKEKHLLEYETIAYKELSYESVVRKAKKWLAENTERIKADSII